jgi:hypothetical protein
METAMPANPNSGMTIWQVFYQLGFFGPIFLLIASILVVWLWILIFRTRPLSDYLAFIAATLYPSFLAFFGGSLSAVHLFRALGDNGIANPEPALIAGYIGEMLLTLIYGTALTCIFLPLGIVVLLVRRPK